MTTTLSPELVAPEQVDKGKRLVRLAVVSAGAAVAAIALAGLLDPGYSARSEAISALASEESKSAAIMIFGFVAMAVTLLASGSYLFTRLKGKAGKAGSALVVVAGVLTLVAGFARQDCSNLQQACLAQEEAGLVSSHHVVHNLVSLVLFLVLIVGTFLLASGVRRSGQPGLGRRTRFAATASLVLLLWFVSGAFGSNGGLVECAFIAVVFGTPVLLATRILGRAQPVG